MTAPKENIETPVIHDDKAHVRDDLDLTGAEWITFSVDEDPDQESDEFPEGKVQLAKVLHTDGVTYYVLRNSHEPDGPVLVYTPAEWTAFVEGVKLGEFDNRWDVDDTEE